MTKHSQVERQRRAAETERMKQIGDAWYASIPAASSIRVTNWRTSAWSRPAGASRRR